MWSFTNLKKNNNNSFTFCRFPSRPQRLLNLVEMPEPFPSVTLQVSSEVPRRAVPSQRLQVPHSFTPPQPLILSTTQVNTFSSQHDESIRTPCTISSPIHPPCCTSQFPASQQLFNAAIPRLTHVFIKNNAMAGSSILSTAIPRPREEVLTYLPFSAPELKSSLSVGQRKKYTSHVFRPWESEKRRKAEISNILDNSRTHTKDYM